MKESEQTLPKLVSISGGTGRYTILKRLKRHFQITAVYNNTDAGGSSGRLRDELGILPMGDGGQCLAALAKDFMTETFLRYRIDRGSDLNGHKVSNFMMMAACESFGLAEGHRFLARQFCYDGSIAYPVSPETNTHLAVAISDRTVIVGEHNIDTSVKNGRIIDAWLTKQKPQEIKLNVKDINKFKADTLVVVSALPEVLQAIHEADLIALGPGSLYTSILANLLVDGIPEAICRSKAKKVYITNFANDTTETLGYSVDQYIETAIKPFRNIYPKFRFDYVFVNQGFIVREDDDGKVSVVKAEDLDPMLLNAYKREGKKFPEIENRKKVRRYTQNIYEGPLVAVVQTPKGPILRHDGKRTANVMLGTYYRPYLNIIFDPSKEALTF